MRVVVVGATGNVGTSLLESLGRDEKVESILGLARRQATATYPKTEFATADVARDDLVGHFRGADCVVHLAWLIQPSHDQRVLRAVNVDGSARVFRAVAEAGVPKLVVASSIGVYSPGPKRRVDESWPRHGVRASWYAQHKAEMERLLDRLEDEHDVQVVRLRPALIMKRESAEEIRRLFTGPLLPSPLLKPGRLPLFPHIPGAVMQLLHSSDVGEAYRLAIVRDVRGAFNVATEPEVDGKSVAEAIGARPVTIPPRVARALAAAAWHARLQPTSPDWLDLALGVPLLDCTRAHEELGWRPEHDAFAVVRELLTGLADRSGGPTPPLRRGGRAAEIEAGVGGKSL
jgi:UDP-glucose 4-epimerase